ncbi:MAG: hypothetical protein ACE5OO_02435 [Candidatus Bathyarchaeia archaeon]
MRELPPAFTKKRREIEPRWVSEYVARFYGRYEVRPRCPLGPIPEDLEKAYGISKARRIHRPYRPEVDCLVISPRRIILIEAKIQKYMDGLSKLPIYKSLIPKTPELADQRDKRVDMELLIPRKIPWIMAAAEEQGIIVKDWAPDWVLKIWEERDKYWTQSSVMKREQRRKTLERLGYD